MDISSAELRVLGPLEIVIHGEPASIFGRKRQVILSALLLARGMAVPLHYLIDAVWDTEPPVTAAKQVRNAISDLRLSLSPYAGVDLAPVDGYRINMTDSVLDAMIFDSRLVRGRKLRLEGRIDEAVAEFRKALSLWRGPALAGLTSPVLEPGLVALEEERLTLLEECIALELTRGRPSALIGELSSLVAANPLRERFAVLLMLALCQAGERAHAIKVYERVRQTLADELGVDPGPELQELWQQIMTGTLTARPVYGEYGPGYHIPFQQGSVCWAAGT